MIQIMFVLVGLKGDLMATTYALITVATIESLLGGINLENEHSSQTDSVVEEILSKVEEQLIGYTETLWTTSTLQSTTDVQAIGCNGAFKDLCKHAIIAMRLNNLIKVSEEIVPKRSEIELTEFLKEIMKPQKDETTEEGSLIIKNNGY